MIKPLLQKCLGTTISAQRGYNEEWQGDAMLLLQLQVIPHVGIINEFAFVVLRSPVLLHFSHHQQMIIALHYRSSLLDPLGDEEQPQQQ